MLPFIGNIQPTDAAGESEESMDEESESGDEVDDGW